MSRGERGKKREKKKREGEGRENEEVG